MDLPIIQTMSKRVSARKSALEANSKPTCMFPSISINKNGTVRDVIIKQTIPHNQAEFHQEREQSSNEN